MANHTKLTLKKREEFLSLLAEGGNVTLSARAIGISRIRLYEVKNSDPNFALAWDNAVNEYREILESEADRRAVQGTTKPMFYQGVQCGEVREYSDTLLMFRLKKLDPAGYRERQDIKHSGRVEHGIKVIAGLEEGDL